MSSNALCYLDGGREVGRTVDKCGREMFEVVFGVSMETIYIMSLFPRDLFLV